MSLRTSGGRCARAALLAGTLMLLAGMLMFLAACAPDPSETGPSVQIGSQRIRVEVADTPERQRRGLGYRDHLPWDHGMYFPYEAPGIQRFWMKGMRFPIDIVWIRHGRIVDLHANVPFVPGENGPTVTPRELIDAVLEVPAGYARASGWRGCLRHT